MYAITGRGSWPTEAFRWGNQLAVRGLEPASFRVRKPPPHPLDHCWSPSTPLVTFLQSELIAKGQQTYSQWVVETPARIVCPHCLSRHSSRECDSWVCHALLTPTFWLVGILVLFEVLWSSPLIDCMWVKCTSQGNPWNWHCGYCWSDPVY